MIRHAALTCALAVIALTPRAAALTVARDGATELKVILAREATPAERTAAEELVAYLERATAARFPLLGEDEPAARSPAIWVGPTAASRRAGLDAAALGPEEWRVRSVGPDLLLVGGRPRGTLYAVYHFLEEQVGVRWWNPFEEHVPSRTVLELEVQAGGRPAFAHRDVLGPQGTALHQVRSRLNGHFAALTAAHGGSERFGPPFLVHTFFMYVPPEEYFAQRPEFFSERDGVRVGERTQLCLTNQGLFDLVRGKLLAYIEGERLEAQREGREPARLFSFSQNDWARPCTCAACRALDRREGGHAGSLVHFINRLADSIAEAEPAVLLTTLAYEYTLEPPRHARVRDNVVVFATDLHQRDFSKAVTHRDNRTARRAIEGWAERARHLRVWAYSVTFGHEPNNLPLPNERLLADDLRFYLAHGVEGLLVQHDHQVHADMWDLKAYVLFKLLEDPARDVERLIVDFTEGYYGPAAATLRRYRDELAEAARRTPSRIPHPTHHRHYDYLTPEFLLRAHALFDQAAGEVAGRPVLERRVRHARLALDRATLWRWDEELAAAAGSSTTPASPLLDPAVVARRLRETAAEQADLRLDAGRRAIVLEALDQEIDEALARIAD